MAQFLQTWHFEDQCHQMPRIFAQYLAICNYINWPKSKLNVQKSVQNFVKYK